MGFIFETFTRDLLALLAIAIAYATYFVHRRYTIWQRKGVPHIPPVFPFGNFMVPVRQQKSFGDHSCDMYHSSSAPTLGVWVGLQPTLFVRDPEIVRTILIKDFNSFRDRGLYCDEVHDPLSGNLFLLPGEKWRNLRNKLSPTFTSGKLKAMFATLVDCGAPLDAFVARAAAAGETIEMRELVAQYTTNNIASVAFGIDVDCIADPESAFRRNGRKIFAPTFRSGLRDAISFLAPDLFKYTGMKSVDADVEEFFMSIVRQNLESREQQKVMRKDFFQLLVQLRNTGAIQEDGNWETKIADDQQGKQMSVGECAAQSFVFFAAGFETSSTTVSFGLYELAKNVECMRRAQREIDEVLDRHAGQITYESVSEMKYLDWVIDETLRKYPPVPFLNRVAAQPWTIPGTNSTIDPGTMIIIPALALQNDPKYYPEPERFIPERFSPEQTADQTFVDRPYLPFGEGPRNCIGLRFGKMQTKVGLITLLRKYDYELSGVTKLPLVMNPASFLLAPVGGINLKITSRAK